MIYQNIDEYMTYISEKCVYQSTHWISKTVKTLNNAIYTSITKWKLAMLNLKHK